MSSDNFEKFADTQSAPIMRKRAAAQQRALDKKERDETILYSQWMKWHNERVQKLFVGPYANAAANLSFVLQKLTPDDAQTLIELVQHGPWAEADDDTKFTVLSIIDRRISMLRESKGLPPFDDALPGEDLTVFQQIREIINGSV